MTVVTTRPFASGTPEFAVEPDRVGVECCSPTSTSSIPDVIAPDAPKAIDPATEMGPQYGFGYSAGELPPLRQTRALVANSEIGKSLTAENPFMPYAYAEPLVKGLAVRGAAVVFNTEADWYAIDPDTRIPVE